MKKNLLLFLIINLSLVSKAQDFDINWSNHIEFDRKSTGEMESFVGANDKYVYSLFSPRFYKLDKTQRTLVVYDKLTMKKMGKLDIKSTVNFNSVCVTNDVVYVLFVDDKKGREVLYGQTYTSSLELITKKKKLYQIRTHSTRNSSEISTIKAITNNKANNNLYILAEKPNVKNAGVQVEFTVVDKSLTTLNTGQVTLPVVSLKNTPFNMSSISVGDDGMLIAKNNINATKEIRKTDKIYSYAMLSVINPETKTIKSLPIKSNGKHIHDFEYFSKNGKLYVAGIYSESIGKRSERGNGVFLSILNSETGELENTKFTEVEAPKVRFDILYLEKIKIHKDGKISMFATEDENIEIVTRDKNGTSTRYENIKGDLLIVNLNSDGSLNWKNTIVRKMVYKELFIRDVQAIINESNAYVTYADGYKNGKRNIFNKRSQKAMRDILTYNKINVDGGEMTTQTLKLNTSTTQKNNKKYVNAAKITEIDNCLYLDGFQTKMKAGVQAIGCATAPVCGLGCAYFVIKYRNGSAFKGGGQLGSIHLK